MNKNIILLMSCSVNQMFFLLCENRIYLLISLVIIKHFIYFYYKILQNHSIIKADFLETSIIWCSLSRKILIFSVYRGQENKISDPNDIHFPLCDMRRIYKARIQLICFYWKNYMYYLDVYSKYVSHIEKKLCSL